MARNHWLVKTEPHVYSLEDWAAEPDKTTFWDGVRNYEARNIMRDDMKLGDRVLIYHSNTRPPCVVGVGEVVKEGYPDHTAWDPESNYHDAKSDPDDPRWFMVDIKLVEALPRPVTLAEVKDAPELSEMTLVKRSRLSVQPVRAEEFERVLEMARSDAP